MKVYYTVTDHVNRNSSARAPAASSAG